MSDEIAKQKKGINIIKIIIINLLRTLQSYIFQTNHRTKKFLLKLAQFQVTLIILYISLEMTDVAHNFFFKLSIAK